MIKLCYTRKRVNNRKHTVCKKDNKTAVLLCCPSGGGGGGGGDKFEYVNRFCMVHAILDHARTSNFTVVLVWQSHWSTYG